MIGTRSNGVAAGVDEVGRGCLAGAVYAAAVILPQNHRVDGLRDSKRISARKREQLAAAIQTCAIGWAIGFASVSEIDELNILQATLLAMKRAIAALPVRPDQVLVDGNRCPEIDIPARAIIGGDAREPAIMAASIIAKVIRDSAMLRLDPLFRGYGFARNKGYGTAAHLEALRILGPTTQHRMSFAPCAQARFNPIRSVALEHESRPEDKV